MLFVRQRSSTNTIQNILQNNYKRILHLYCGFLVWSAFWSLVESSLHQLWLEWSVWDCGVGSVSVQSERRWLCFCQVSHLVGLWAELAIQTGLMSVPFCSQKFAYACHSWWRFSITSWFSNSGSENARTLNVLHKASQFIWFFAFPF